MPVRGWKAVGVSVREEEYPILMEKLKMLGFNSLQQFVKALLADQEFTSKQCNFTSKDGVRVYPRRLREKLSLQENGGSDGRKCRGPDLNRRQSGLQPDALPG